METVTALDKLMLAAQMALLTIRFAQTKINPEDFATVPDWNRVAGDLQDALRDLGHPAGNTPRWPRPPDPRGPDSPA